MNCLSRLKKHTLILNNLMIKLFIIFTFFFHVAKSEVYYVTFVKGGVKLQGAKINLKVGDKLSDNDQLVFADQLSKISCISPVKGRFDILGSKAKKKVQMEWVAVLKDVLLPASTKAQLSTRGALGEETNDPLKIFKSPYFDNKILIIENNLIFIDPNYVLDNKHFFFLQYEVRGKVILKMVPSASGGILFNSDLFIDDNGNKLLSEDIGMVSFCYQDAGESKELTKFIPVIISLSELTKQVLLLRTNLSKKNKEEVNKEVYNHFINNYGFIQAGLLQKILKQI